jgi:hypothetical protein
MDLNKLMIKDSSGKKSATMTAFVLGFITVNIKLLLSGLTIAGYSMSAFSGTEYAAAVGALGAIYVLRRNVNNNNQNK